jgi:hypothetical protein
MQVQLFPDIILFAFPSQLKQFVLKEPLHERQLGWPFKLNLTITNRTCPFLVVIKIAGLTLTHK